METLAGAKHRGRYDRAEGSYTQEFDCSLCD